MRLISERVSGGKTRNFGRALASEAGPILDSVTSGLLVGKPPNVAQRPCVMLRAHLLYFSESLVVSFYRDYPWNFCLHISSSSRI